MSKLTEPPSPWYSLVYFRPTRFVNGAIATYQPAGIDNLELGIARMTQVPMPDGSIPLNYYFRALGTPIKTGISNGGGRGYDGDNQIASVFARWVFPRSGLEVYAEYGKEDYLWDLRYIAVSPDEQVARLFGVRKAVRRADGSIDVVRAEILNYERGNVDRARGGAQIYIHASGANQGNTNGGLMLGAPLVPGSSAGAELAWDHYLRDGRLSVSWRRDILGDRQATANPVLDPQALWVRHALTAERLWYRGRIDITAGATYALDLNRNYTSDQSGLSTYVSIKAPWR
jgi:hypothetical protein